MALQVAGREVGVSDLMHCRIKRRGFLLGALVFWSAAVGGSVFFAKGRRTNTASQSAGSRPRRNRKFAATAEPTGTWLATEGDKGLSAPTGFRLNPVAARIWNLADGTRSVEAIAQMVSQECAVPYETSLTDTCAFVRVLLDCGFLEAV